MTSAAMMRSLMSLPSKVYDVAEFIALGKGVDIGGDVLDAAEERLPGDAGKVRRQQDVVEVAEGRVGRLADTVGGRVRVPHVQSGTVNGLVSKGFVERLLLYERSAGDVHEYAVRAEPAEFGGADDAAGGFGQWRGDDERVGFLKQAWQLRGVADPVQSLGVGLAASRDGLPSRAERSQYLPGRAADVPQSDEPDRCTLQRRRLRHGGVVHRGQPSSLPERGVCLREFATQGDQRPDDVLGDRRLVVIGVRDDDLVGERIDLDAIGAGAGDLNEPETGSGVRHRLRERRSNQDIGVRQSIEYVVLRYPDGVGACRQQRLELDAQWQQVGVGDDDSHTSYRSRRAGVQPATGPVLWRTTSWVGSVTARGLTGPSAVSCW